MRANSIFYILFLSYIYICSISYFLFLYSTLLIFFLHNPLKILSSHCFFPLSFSSSRLLSEFFFIYFLLSPIFRSADLPLHTYFISSLFLLSPFLLFLSFLFPLPTCFLLYLSSSSLTFVEYDISNKCYLLGA